MKRTISNALGVAILLHGLAGYSLTAQAALGEPAASVEADRRQIHAHAAQSNVGNGFTVQEMTAASGTVVREYISPSGVVFAVTWQGPVLPDFAQILGGHFATFANSPNRLRGGRGHLIVQDGDLVVESNGRLRAFQGRAYLTDAIPPGVTLEEIR